MKTHRIIIWVSILAIAMAFLESSIVVYLRELYYPEGFSFPLKTMDLHIAGVEFFREIATLIMLTAIGIIAGRTNYERFAYFIYSFAVWDIFYYIFLKILVNWPLSFLTWDILFLVPFTWVGPVICPIINSLTMILLASVIIFFVQKQKQFKIGFLNWLLLVLGSLIVIFSYTEGYIKFMIQDFSFFQLIFLTEKDLILTKALTFTPKQFNWYLFLAGELFHLLAIVNIAIKNYKSSKVIINF